MLWRNTGCQLDNKDNKCRKGNEYEKSCWKRIK